MRGRERAPPPSRTANDNTLWPIPPPISPAASGRAAAVGQGAEAATRRDQGATEADRGREPSPLRPLPSAEKSRAHEPATSATFATTPAAVTTPTAPAPAMRNAAAERDAAGRVDEGGGRAPCSAEPALSGTLGPRAPASLTTSSGLIFVRTHLLYQLIKDRILHQIYITSTSC